MSPLFYYKRKKMGIAIYACITVVRHNISKSALLTITISRAFVFPYQTALKLLWVTGLCSPAAFAASSFALFNSTRRTISFRAYSSPICSQEPVLPVMWRGGVFSWVFRQKNLPLKIPGARMDSAALRALPAEVRPSAGEYLLPAFLTANSC